MSEQNIVNQNFPSNEADATSIYDGYTVTFAVALSSAFTAMIMSKLCNKDVFAGVASNKLLLSALALQNGVIIVFSGMLLNSIGDVKNDQNHIIYSMKSFASGANKGKFMIGQQEEHYIKTGPENDVIRLTNTGYNYICSGRGDDFIESITGNNEICASAGNNVIILGAGNETVDIKPYNATNYIENFNIELDKIKIYKNITFPNNVSIHYDHPNDHIGLFDFIKLYPTLDLTHVVVHYEDATENLLFLGNIDFQEDHFIYGGTPPAH